MAIPGSHMRKLEAITGLSVVLENGAWCLKRGEDVVCFTTGRSEKRAIDWLRGENWKRVTNNVYRRQGWKCGRCDKMKPLQGHHIRFRSRWRREDGPLDIEGNVEGLCSSCHEDIHRNHQVVTSLETIDEILAQAEREDEA
jgi:5-methylcytosine-specific restriction endonuclease McrA